jgi:hypothetical protein
MRLGCMSHPRDMIIMNISKGPRRDIFGEVYNFIWSIIFMHQMDGTLPFQGIHSESNSCIRKCKSRLHSDVLYYRMPSHALPDRLTNGVIMWCKNVKIIILICATPLFYVIIYYKNFMYVVRFMISGLGVVTIRWIVWHIEA